MWSVDRSTNNILKIDSYLIVYVVNYTVIYLA